MNDLLARAGSLFVAAPEAAPVRPAVAQTAPRFAALLAREEDVPPAAGGVAAALRHAARSRTAVVCRPGDAPAARPATASARSLAHRLVARDDGAAAAGCLVHVGLSVDPTDAIRAVWRLVSAVDVPVLLALPGRVDGFDVLLAEADRLHLAVPPTADEALATLAIDSLARLGPPVCVVRSPTTALARRAAALGLRRLDADGQPAEAPA